MALDPHRARAVFLEVVGVPAAERAAALGRACGGDVPLRQRVEALLQAQEKPGPWERPRQGRCWT